MADRRAVALIWAASQEADGAVLRPRGNWSLVQWADAISLLQEDEISIGVAALSNRASISIGEARLALLPDHRASVEAARELVRCAVSMAKEARAQQLRLFIATSAGWARSAAEAEGFQVVRAIHRMLRPASAPALPVQLPPDIRVRPLKLGEDEIALAALNEAWADTWNFHPITMRALAADLEGQREGFLIAVAEPEGNRVAGTVHAIFDPKAKNPDGSPSAWISNLTTVPARRGRGLGRALLAAGLQHLRSRGAGSVALGVDGGNPVPMSLYLSVGFEIVSTTELWEREI